MKIDKDSEGLVLGIIVAYFIGVGLSNFMYPFFAMILTTVLFGIALGIKNEFFNNKE